MEAMYYTIAASEARRQTAEEYWSEQFTQPSPQPLAPRPGLVVRLRSLFWRRATGERVTRQAKRPALLNR